MNSESIGISDIKVINIETKVLSFSLGRPFKAAISLIPTVDFVVAEIQTSAGIRGIGYIFAFGKDHARILKSLVENLGQLLVNQNPLEIRRLWQMMWASLTFFGQSGAGITAMAALDIALWDILGKVSKQPLYRVLGAARSDVPAYASSGSLNMSRNELTAEMVGYVEAGYRSIKLKIGRSRFEEDLDYIKALREALGDGVKIIVDGNQRWSPKQAIYVARQLQEYEIWWLEEPVTAYDFEGYAEVRANAEIFIATGETVFTPHEFKNLVQVRAADILMPNLQRVGGITGWLKVADLAELYQLPVASHVYSEINVHLLAAIPNGLVLEVVPWWPRIFVENLQLTEGKANPPDRPGIGVTLDEKVVRDHRVE